MTFTPSLLPKIPPPILGSLLSSGDITIIDTPDGAATYSFDGGKSILNVETGGDTYTSTVGKVHFVPARKGRKSNSLSGEDFRFSSTTYISNINIDGFSFLSTDSAFQFKLDGVESSWGNTEWGGDSFTVTHKDTIDKVKVRKVYVRDTNGQYIEIGQANYTQNKNKKNLEMTSVLGSYDGKDFFAKQIQYMQDGDNQHAHAEKLYISDGPGGFVQVGTAKLKVSPDNKFLGLTAISGNAEGYDFSANTFNYNETGNHITGNATGVFVKNAAGDFVKIGTADYTKSANGQENLKLTSVLGQQGSTNFSADQLSLMHQGNTDIGKGINLYISDSEGQFVKVGKADFTRGSKSNELMLTAISGESNGYKLSADSLYANNSGDQNHLDIVNGKAVGKDDRLTFANAVIDSDGKRISADFDRFSASSGDLSYTTNRLKTSTDGKSIDIDTQGVLSSGDTNLDLNFKAKGISGVGGGVQVEKDSKGNIINAEGSAYITTTADGGISNIGVALGKEISFTATDKDGNAKALTASFSYDKEAGKFFLKTVFKDGDKTEIKIMPFKFASEKIGDDAVAALSAQINKQDVQTYLNTMTNIIDLQKVNDYLAIGENRMQVRIGHEAGMEFYYQNDNHRPDNYYDPTDFHNPKIGNNLALGVGFFNRGKNDDVHSGGILISSDSNLCYDIQAGTLSVAGVDLPDKGKIPLTIGTYYRYQDDKGNAIFGTLGTSLVELGGVSAGVTAEHRVNDSTSWNVGVAGNTHGDYAVRAGFSIRFSASVNDSPRSQSSYDPHEVGNMARSGHGARSSAFGQ